MYLHCDEYWVDMDLMVKNFENGIDPISENCHHPTPCPKCAKLNGNVIIKIDGENHEISHRVYIQKFYPMETIN